MKDKFNIRKSQNSFLFIIICLLISSLTKRDSYITLTSCHSKIILKINVSGNQKVLSPDYQGTMPNSVFLNGSSIELENSKEYAFSSSFNIIELNWNDDLTSCAKMFSGCSNIIEIDLSQLNGNNVRSFNNMFENCFSLTSINISNLNTSASDDMSYMFHNCSKIKSLDLSSFDTHLVTKMDYMFSGCESLEYLNISSFNTPKLINIIRMFHNCKLLNSLDLSNFDTSLVANMSMIFENCENLIHLDIKFNTSNAVDMKRLFYNCRSLSSLNVSTFDTSNVWMMVNMFGYCESLKSLDLSSFNAKSIRNMHSMFSNCYSLTSLNLSNFIDPPLNNINGIFENDYQLEYLDISHFDTSKVTIMSKAFKNCKSLKSLNLSNFNTLLVQSMEQMFLNCSSIRYLDLSNFNTSIVTDMSKMFSGCNNLIYINLKNSIDSKLNKYTDIFKNTPEIMIFCINEDLNSKLFNFIKDNKLNSTINCSENIDINYFPEIIFSTDTLLSSIIDINEEIIMSTFTNFATSTLPMEISEVSSTFQETSFVLEQSESIKYNIENSLSTEQKEIIKESTYLSLISSKKENIRNNFDNLLSSILLNEKNEDNETEYYDEILELIDKYILSDNFDLSNIEQGEDEIIPIEKMKVTITTTNNQRNNIDKNITTIDLYDCETSLRETYNISDNTTIYMRMIEVKEEGMKIPKVEYDVYSQLSSNKLEKLNLSVCQKDKIIISIPVELNEHIDKLNIKSGYYNDACYKATSDDGTDITLKDRKNEFIDGNKTLCQEDCDFSDYNYTTHKVSCSCQVKVSYSSVDCMNINKTKLLENLKNIKNIANVKILSCYRTLFILNSFSNNIGNYIISALLIFHIISLFIFFIKKIKLIYRKIGKIISDIKQKIDDNTFIEDRRKKNKNLIKKNKKKKKSKK